MPPLLQHRTVVVADDSDNIHPTLASESTDGTAPSMSSVPSTLPSQPLPKGRSCAETVIEDAGDERIFSSVSASTSPSPPPVDGEGTTLERTNDTSGSAEVEAHAQPDDGGVDPDCPVKSTKRQRRSASVSFSPQVQVRHIPPRLSYTHTESRATWYSRAELRSIRYDAAQTVVQVNRRSRALSLGISTVSGPAVDEFSDTETLHGLENMFRPVSQQRKVVRQNVLETIQMQQELEQVSGPDPEWMAVLCRNMTSASRNNAEQRGLDHEQHVQALLNDLSEVVL